MLRPRSHSWPQPNDAAQGCPTGTSLPGEKFNCPIILFTCGPLVRLRTRQVFFPHFSGSLVKKPEKFFFRFRTLQARSFRLRVQEGHAGVCSRERRLSHLFCADARLRGRTRAVHHILPTSATGNWQGRDEQKSHSAAKTKKDSSPHGSCACVSAHFTKTTANLAAECDLSSGHGHFLATPQTANVDNNRRSIIVREKT